MRLRRLARSSYASREGRRAARARVKPDLILSVILSARGGSGSSDVTWSACDLPAAWKQVLSKFRNRTETLGVAAEVSPAMEGINNEALIACVEARPALWQAKHKHHKNKHMTRCLWTEVARIVMPDAAVTGKCSLFYTGVIREHFRTRSSPIVICVHNCLYHAICVEPMAIQKFDIARSRSKACVEPV